MTCYATKEEAKELAEDLKRRTLTRFCPLARTTCNSFCVCYKEPCVKSDLAQNLSTMAFVKSYRIEGGCTNKLFFGEQ